MKNKQVILEGNCLISKETNFNKKKKNSLPRISFLFISALLILNLYLTIKLVTFHKNSDKKVLKNENKLKEYNKYISEKKKGQDYKYMEINKNREYFNFNKISIETVDLHILNLIENEIKFSVQLTFEEQKFLHGLIRITKPKKIVEIGVYKGGSSALILNAIKDIDGSKLFSIDKAIKHGKKENFQI